MLILLCFALSFSSDRPAVFTAVQAQEGEAAYRNTCGQCHTSTLLGRKGEPGELPPLSLLSPGWQKFIATSRGIVPPLAGKAFQDRWGSRSIAQLILRLQEAVPAFPPEGMNDQTTVNIAAYVLLQNGAKPGSLPLTRNTRDILNSVIP